MPDQLPPVVDTRRCSGCGRCVAACPVRIITLETINHHKTALITDKTCCTGCAACIKACPLGALS